MMEEPASPVGALASLAPKVPSATAHSLKGTKMPPSAALPPDAAEAVPPESTPAPVAPGVLPGIAPPPVTLGTATEGTTEVVPTSVAEAVPEPQPIIVDATPISPPSGEAAHPMAEGAPPGAAPPIPAKSTTRLPRPEECGLWVYQSNPADGWIPFAQKEQRLLELAHRAGERVVDVRLEQSDWLADLKTGRLMGQDGVLPIRRRAPAVVVEAKRQGLAEWRAQVAAADKTMDEFEARLRGTFCLWREAVERREVETLQQLDKLKSEYRDAVADAYEWALRSLSDAGVEMDREQRVLPAELLRLTFKHPVDKSFLVRRTDEGFVLKWREPVRAGDRSSPGKPLATATASTASGDYHFVTAVEAIHKAPRSWAFRFDKGRYLMAGLVRADATDHSAAPWRGDAFLWQLNFSTTNGGKLGTVAPGLLNQSPIKAGSVLTFTFDPHSGTLACSVGSQKSVVVGTGIRGAVVPAFVLHRGEEITVLHTAPLWPV
eukprot:GGOE01041123.1.p1 GENE.GGOE01041123.1~~GGOE01041123.1.p1  ORF type:complete len:490 (-),score=105.91 GGOE01041123.1:153-1622(-)